MMKDKTNIPTGALQFIISKAGRSNAPGLPGTGQERR